MWKWIRRSTIAGLSAVPSLLWGALKMLPGLPGHIDDTVVWKSWFASVWGWVMTTPFWFDALAIMGVFLAVSVLTWDWWWQPFRVHILRKPSVVTTEEEHEYTHLTSDEITGAVPLHPIERMEFESSEIGKWHTVEESVYLDVNVQTDPIEIAVTNTAYLAPIITLCFDNKKWIGRLAGLKAGDSIAARGKIAEVSEHGFTLQNCELIGINKDQR